MTNLNGGCRSGRVIAASIVAALGTWTAVAAPAQASAGPKVVVSPVGEIQAGGVGVVVHETITCSPGQYSDGSLSLYQGSGKALAQRTTPSFPITCDSKPHSMNVLIDVPIYDFNGSEDEGGYFAERPSVAFVPGPAAIVVGFGVGQKQITLTARTHNQSSSVVLPSTVTAVGHGLALPVSASVSCTGTTWYQLIVSAAQRNSPLLKYNSAKSPQYPCDGTTLTISLLVTASDRLWHTGPVELSASWCALYAPCTPAWRTSTIH
jgi:hypothetical protein